MLLTCDHLPRVGSNNVHPQDPVRGCVRQDLDLPLRILHCARAAVRGEGEHALRVFDARLLQLLLRLADGRHLGDIA